MFLHNGAVKLTEAVVFSAVLLSILLELFEATCLLAHFPILSETQVRFSVFEPLVLPEMVLHLTLLLCLPWDAILCWAGAISYLEFNGFLF